MKIGILGPEGTYCHRVAAEAYPQAALYFKESIDAVFLALLKGQVTHVVVPLKNTLSGEVRETAQNLEKASFQTIEEITLRISHDLVGFGTLEEIEKILAHPHSFLQCETTVRALSPSALHVEVKSNAEAALICSEKKDKTLAALVPPQARELYDLPLLISKIEDREENFTTFLVLGVPL